MGFICRAAAATVLFAVAGGCTTPFNTLGEVVSIPWGLTISPPKDVSAVHDEGAVYYYGKMRTWSVALQVRRFVDGYRGEGTFRLDETGRLLALAREAAGKVPNLRWIRGEPAVFGNKKGIQIDFEAPAGGGQANIFFTRGEMLIQRVFLLRERHRLYLIRMMAQSAVPERGLGAWEELKNGVRITGRPLVMFPNRDRLPAATPASLLLGVFQER